MRSVVVGVCLAHLLAVIALAAAVLAGAGAPVTAALPLLVGCALAWLWGVQHGLAADHVAAIDDVTRMRLGPAAASTGTHFAVGHGLAVCAGVLAVSGAWSGVAAVEVPARVVVAVVLSGLCGWNVHLLRAARGAGRAEAALAGAAAGGAPAPRSLLLGLLLRLGPRAGRDGPAAASWWQVVGLGIVFGLVSIGEVLVMALAVGPREGGVLTLLAVAVCFSAGMVLTDSGDSMLLARMYAWSGSHTMQGASLARRATLLTAVVSGVVATTITVGLLAESGLVRSGPLLALAGLGERYVLMGAAVVGVFIVLWGVTWVWSRWSGSGPSGPPEGGVCSRSGGWSTQHAVGGAAAARAVEA